MDSGEPDLSSHSDGGNFLNQLQAPCLLNSETNQKLMSNHHGSEIPKLIIPPEGSLDINDLQNFQEKIASNEYKMNTNGESDCSDRKISLVNASEAEIAVKDEESTYSCLVLQVGLEFESEDHAFKCYSRYAVMEGFSIRKDFVNKSRLNGAVVSRRYTCHRQGYRPTRQILNPRKSRQETRTGCLAHMTIARQHNGKFCITHLETKHNHDLVLVRNHLLPTQKRMRFDKAVESELVNKPEMDGEPRLGMAFASEDDAYEIYNAYAGRVGFSIRKDYVNRSKIDGAVASRRFTCFREGFRQRDKRDLLVKRPRKETRIGCLAQLVISRQPDGKYRVTHFEEKHNHELVAVCRIRMLRSQKKLASAQDIGSKIGPRSAFNLKCNNGKSTEGIQYDETKCTTKLSTRRVKEMKEGEAERILQYFQSKQVKNPAYFYRIQLDVEEQITNIFWADSKMLEDYSDFGDVVWFDTTFRLHKECRPFVAFVGINHHKQKLIFGAALLYDETVNSFNWLLQTFMETMSGKRPRTMLTDQDDVIAESIRSVLPETDHRFCVWQVYQNILSRLTHNFPCNELDSFANDLGCCLFTHEEEADFTSAWKLLLDEYALWENNWLNEIYGLREKWLTSHGKHIFCADIKSVLGDSFTSSLKKYLNFDSDVLSFFKQIRKLINDWHYKELEVNYEMGNNIPTLMGDVVMLKQTREIYTPKVFEEFQNEYETSLNLVINDIAEVEPLMVYKVSIYQQLHEYTVSFNQSTDMVSCSCMMFESRGILCSHGLKVLDFRNIKILPSHYFLKRWTRNARV